MTEASCDIILAADTTTEINTVALTQGNALLAEATIQCRRKHSERLLETVDWLLDQAALTLEAVDCLAISNGPGSFTGLRIGAATWKGLAFALNKPLIAVPTLDALALSAPCQEGMLFVALDARMGEVFGALYTIDRRAAQPSDILNKLQPEAVGPVGVFLQDIGNTPFLCLGDGALLYQEEIRTLAPEAVIAMPWLAVPRAAAIGVHAYHLQQQGVDTNPATLNPVYLRKSQAEINREKRLRQN